MIETIIFHAGVVLLNFWMYLQSPPGSVSQEQYFHFILFWIVMFKFQHLRHEIKTSNGKCP